MIRIGQWISWTVFTHTKKMTFNLRQNYIIYEALRNLVPIEHVLKDYMTQQGEGGQYIR